MEVRVGMAAGMIVAAGIVSVAMGLAVFVGLHANKKKARQAVIKRRRSMLKL